MEPTALDPGQGTTIQGPVGGPLTFKLRRDQSGGALTALENVVPPGAGPPLHVHSREDESWYVLEGELRFRLGDQMHDAAPGSFVFAPRGTPHCFKNVGDAPARLLVIFTPSGMEAFFERFTELPPGPEAFDEAGRAAGMQVVGPPL